MGIDIPPIQIDGRSIYTHTCIETETSIDEVDKIEIDEKAQVFCVETFYHYSSEKDDTTYRHV